MATTGDLIAAEAQKHLNKPYVYAGAGPNSFDCSGLVYYCVLQVTGQSISHASRTQYTLGTAVAVSDLKPGDILCFNSLGNGYCEHVGIYLGNNKMVNALNVDKGVIISDITSSYWQGIYMGARRLFPYSGTPTPPPTSVPKFQINDTVRVIEALNMRSSASISASVVATLAASTTGTVLAGPTSADGYQWYRIQTASGTGWGAQDWLQKQSLPAPPPPATGRFAKGDVIRAIDTAINLRTSASTSASIIGTLDTGAIATVVAGPMSANGYTWYQLQTTIGIGWAVETYFVVQQGEPPAPKFAQNDEVRVTTALNFRSGPGTSYSVVGSLTVGATASVAGGPSSANGYIWWQLRTSFGSGWAIEDGLTKTGSDVPPPVPPSEPAPPTTTYTHKVTSGPLNLRSASNTSATVIGSMPNGTRLRVISGPVSNQGFSWYNIEAEGFGAGWCVNGFDPI
jgi:uncharacterized protein YgiM (DUF1202 family)